MQEQIRGTHWRDVAPCYPPPGLFARVIRGPVRSGVAGIRTLGFTTWSLAEIRYRSATSPRRCLCPAKVGGWGGEIRTFICSCTTDALAYTYNPGHLLPRHERTWRRSRRSVPFLRPCAYTRLRGGGSGSGGGCFRNFRWIGTFVKASPPSGEGHRRRGERAWS